MIGRTAYTIPRKECTSCLAFPIPTRKKNIGRQPPGISWGSGGCENPPRSTRGSGLVPGLKQKSPCCGATEPHAQQLLKSVCMGTPHPN